MTQKKNPFANSIFNTKETLEKSVKVPIYGLGGKDGDYYIMVHNKESRVYKNADHEWQKQNTKNISEIAAEDSKDKEKLFKLSLERVEYCLNRCVSAWNLDIDVECTPENVAAFLELSPSNKGRLEEVVFGGDTDFFEIVSRSSSIGANKGLS